MKLLSRNLPVIVTGDFNAVPTDDPIKVLTDEKDPRHLTHARTLAPCATDLSGLSTIMGVFLWTNVYGLIISL